jgi:hypothetical protein
MGGRDRAQAPGPAAPVRPARHRPPRPAAAPRSLRHRPPRLAAALKFLRHLAAACLVVAAVVAAGLAWGHFADTPLPGRGPGVKAVDVRGQAVEILPPGARPGRGAPPRGVHLIRPGHDTENLGLDSMFQAVNLPVLRDTVEIEAGVIAAVMLLEIGHRQVRRARRARRLASASTPTR